MTVYERIALAMKTKGVTAYRLSKETGIGQATISSWKTLGYAPSAKALAKISDYLGVSADYLLYGDDQKEKENSLEEFPQIPVLGMVPCGVPKEAIENVIEYIAVLPNQSDCYGLLAKGDSMSPLIQDGDILIIRNEPVTESNRVCIVKVNGYEATCKRVVYQKDGLMLVPANPAYQPQFFSAEEIATLPVSVIGEVVEVRRRLR